MMNENELSKIVISTAIELHRELGPGLLERVYQEILGYELERKGLRIRKEVAVPVVWDNVDLDIGFRMDLVVEEKLVLELKSIEAVAPVHKKILLTYLRLSNHRLGLLLNFGEELMKTGISRVVNNLKE